MILDAPLRRSTIVTFPDGAVCGEGQVLFAVLAADRPGYAYVVTDRTPMHPVSFLWPDQPADTGHIAAPDGDIYPVVNVLTGAVRDRDGTLLLGDAAAVLKRSGDAWHAVAVHIIRCEGSRRPEALLGRTVALHADPERRHRLSVHHTAVHLSALALNRTTAGCWTKPPPATDAFGQPDFDRCALTSAAISLSGSADTYRMGKSLRKKGIDRDRVLAGLDGIREAVNATVDEWLRHPAAVTLDPREGPLDARRCWTCDLPPGRAVMPCGGTHVRHLGQLGRVVISLEAEEDGFVMRTSAGH
ncbi:metal-dependent hydrolase (plasmid) [Azospirillum argentinense]|uniref:Metal-dependent hydrolase n=1 Tax=Azospirillum argentinense TaxID=2970906 RepID=A0A4D8PSJ1_9PROT|nr:metal-dependent hydrolase [Azospirillum argentinense]QCO00281.1 metal-dependent hydrolase [Azospirillum argentinense]